MNFIKDLCIGEPGEWVHNLFVRYGRGEFHGPHLEVEVKKKLKIKASYELSGYIGYLISSNSEGKFKVDGGIFSKIDFRQGLDEIGVEYDDKSKKRYFIAKFNGQEMDSKTISDIYTACVGANALLSLKPLDGQNSKIASGKKPPKPGKEEQKTDFVKADMDAKLLDILKSEIFFDSTLGEFQKASVSSKYNISELEIPGDIPADQARLKALRVGKIIRKTIIDDQEEEKEYDLKI